MTLANIVELTYIRNATDRQGEIQPFLLELDKNLSHLHTGDKAEGRRKKTTGNGLRAKNDERWVIENDQLAIVN